MSFLDQVSLEPVYGWAFFVPLLVITVASLWLTATSPGLTRRQKSILSFLRLLAMLILFIGFLQPGWISEQTRESEGAVAVLMDNSQSMSLPSDSAGLSRWQLQQQVWQELQSQTDLEIGRTKLIPYWYSGKPLPVDGSDLPQLSEAFQVDPSARLTDLGQTLSEISRLQVDPPLRGVVMMGDATQTAIPTNFDPTVVSRQMAQLDQVLLFVGLGNQADQSQLRDISIEGLPEQYSAFVKKELNVRFIVNAKGMQNRPIKLQLKLRSSGKPDQIVASKQVLASKPADLLPQDFRIQVTDPGDYLLEASAEVDGGDQIESNNTALSFITVREGGAKILLLEGEPRTEQTFMKRSIDESLDFSLDRAWIGVEDRKRSPGGLDLTKDFAIDEYDAIIIGDLPATALSRETQDAIRKQVSAGSGILFMGGYQSFDAGGWGTSLMEPLFPLQLSRRPAQKFDAPINPRLHIQGEIMLTPKLPHPLTNLGLPEPDNTRLWQNLKPLNGMNRFGDTKNTPGIQTLLEGRDGDGQPEPALITGPFGSGRVLAFAGDTTYLWWFAGQKKVHQRFWRQIVLWLIRRDSINEGFKLELDRRRLLIDETPELQATWFGGSENKPLPETVSIKLFREQETLQTLPLAEESADKLSSTIKGLDKPGLYRAALDAQGADGSIYSSEVAFVVRDESRELMRPDADWSMMRSIVAANENAGGKLILSDEVSRLIEILEQRQEATQVTSIEKRRLGDAAWDSWLFLVLFCALMGAEWTLRKTWQLP
ncbi:MAG: hypothetical protein AB8B50_03080 [Pirellulaceae bacterium]